MTDKSNWTMAERREKALRDGYDQIAHHAHQIGLIIKRGSLAAFEDEPTAPSPAQAGVEAVAVKKLEWNKVGSHEWRAVTVFGDAVILEGAHGDFVWRIAPHTLRDASGSEKSLEAAQSVLWANYEARIRSALTPAPAPVEPHCTICKGTGVTSQSFGMGTSPGECPVCSRAKPAPVDDGPFWDSPPGRWDDGDHNDEPYSETPTNPALVEARGEAINPAAMTERLIDAAIYAETASGAYVREARKEVNEARAAIEAALAKPAPAVEAVREALQTSLSEMLEARDRLLCYHARTSGLDHGIEEARRALAALAPAAQAGTVAQEGRRVAEEYEAALRPMADVASDIPDEWDDNHQCITACGHFRRARSVLPQKEAASDD